MSLPNILNETMMQPDRIAFRRKVLLAVVEENLDALNRGKPMAGVMWDMVEEAYMLGVAFSDNVYTDAEVDEVNKAAYEKLESLSKNKP